MVLEKSAQEARFVLEILRTKLEIGVVEFSAQESISAPFALNLSLASEEEINFDDVVGQEARLTILGEKRDRYFHGIINQFMQTGSKGRFLLYKATVVPSLWLLSLEQDCRIFQNKKVEDIIRQILQDAGIPSNRFDFRLQDKDKYKEREYCVQYRETDLNFISRLLEEEGIFFFFEHTQDKHVVVFADSPVAYQAMAGEANVTFNPGKGMVPEKEYIYEFVFSQGIYSGKITRQDFNFEKPALDLTTQEQSKPYQKLEVYDYPGRYLDQERGKKLSQVRLQESVTFKEKAEGQSVCPRLMPGLKFKLTDHERKKFNQEYLLVEVQHKGIQPQTLEERASAEGKSDYTNQFVCIPSAVTFRPSRKTPRPFLEGPQTAIVVGPKGEEIYTDKHGRVKVQFHWDREGKRDEKSSCWIRVGSGFAGGNYGMLFIPRVGQEVIVDFLEGDPDQPIITGRVYNADNMPPYNLPDEKTKSTIKSHSSTGGDGFNEIRFEDKKGEEQIFIHAEKNMDIRVKSNRKEWIGNNQDLIVKKDQMEHVENNRHEIVDNDHLEEIGKDRHLKIKGKEAKEVGQSLSLTVKGDVIEVFKANHSEQTTSDYYLKAMNVVIEGLQNITLSVGGSYIAIEPANIEISTSGQLKINGTQVQVDGRARTTIQGGAMTEIKGAIVKIN